MGISQNGDDAIELFYNGAVVETFGDIAVDGSGETWEYLDSWAYKVNGQWTFGGVDCTDGSTTTCDSSCPYPFAVSSGVCETPSEVPTEPPSEELTTTGTWAGLEAGPNAQWPHVF